GDGEDQRDQESLRDPIDEFALARGGDEIGAGRPAADEAGRADGPPGKRRDELRFAAGNEVAQHRIEADAEYRQHDVHGERGKHAAGDCRGVVQASEGVGVHAGTVSKRLRRRGCRRRTIADALRQGEAPQAPAYRGCAFSRSRNSRSRASRAARRAGVSWFAGSLLWSDWRSFNWDDRFSIVFRRI